MNKQIIPARHAGFKFGPSSNVYASIDTFEVFIPPNVTAERFAAFYPYGHVQPSLDAKQRPRGRRFIRNRPDRTTLLRVDRLAYECGGVLSRFDISYDIQPPPTVSLEELMSWIACSAILKWRRKGPMQNYENGAVYWQMGSRSGRRPSRNFVVYEDEYNRVSGEPNCTHLEIRFLRADTIRRQGILRIKDLIGLDPRQLFARNVTFTDIGQAHIENRVRRAVRDDIEQHRRQEASEFGDRYRANIANRTRGLLHRLGEDRSQFVKDAFGGRKVKVIEPPFAIPHELSW